jgi:hypothetical protein
MGSASSRAKSASLAVAAAYPKGSDKQYILSYSTSESETILKIGSERYIPELKEGVLFDDIQFYKTISIGDVRAKLDNSVLQIHTLICSESRLLPKLSGASKLDVHIGNKYFAITNKNEYKKLLRIPEKYLDYTDSNLDINFVRYLQGKIPFAGMPCHKKWMYFCALGKVVITADAGYGYGEKYPFDLELLGDLAQILNFTIINITFLDSLANPQFAGDYMAIANSHKFPGCHIQRLMEEKIIINAV